jgi:putative AlgH/UPF0301 family transcriptional regulator
MAVSSRAFLSRQLLLSMPGIGDPRFRRVVITMSMTRTARSAFVVNRAIPQDLTVPELMRQLEIDQTPHARSRRARWRPGGIAVSAASCCIRLEDMK